MGRKGTLETVMSRRLVDFVLRGVMARNYSEVLTCRVSLPERRLVEALAATEGKRLSAYLREHIVRRITEELGPMAADVATSSGSKLLGEEGENAGASTTEATDSRAEVRHGRRTREPPTRKGDATNPAA